MEGGGGGTSPDDDIFCGEGQDRLRKSVSSGQNPLAGCVPQDNFRGRGQNQL